MDQLSGSMDGSTASVCRYKSIVGSAKESGLDLNGLGWTWMDPRGM